MKNKLFMFATSSLAALLFIVAQSGAHVNSWGLFYSPKIPDILRK